MSGAWPWLAAAAMAALNWAAAARGWRRVIYLTKPAVMLLLLSILYRSGAVPGRLTGFFAGAVLGLAGDVFLMLPGRRTFFYGLAAFLAGHLAYGWAFQPWPLGRPLAAALLALGLGVFAVGFGRRLDAGLQRSGLQRLRAPVLAYILVVSLMAWSAWLTPFDPRWPAPAAALACGGALLFLASDSLLAWDRFVKKLPHARLLVMVTYHLAQAGILAGALGLAGPA